MAHSEPVLYRNLSHFMERNSPEGRFLRYCKGRRRYMPARQILTIAAALVLAGFVSLEMGIGIGLLVFAGEVLDYLTLGNLVRRQGQGEDVYAKRFRAVISAVVQSTTVAIAILTTVALDPEETWFFAMAFTAGAVWDVGLLHYVFPAAARARAAVFSVLGVFATFFYVAQIEAGAKFHLLDALGTLILAYMVWAFLQYAWKQAQNNLRFEQGILEKTEELETKNEEFLAVAKRVRRLARVAESAQDMVVIVDKEGRVDWVNDAFVRTTGHSRGDVLGQTLEILNGPETDLATIKKISQHQEHGWPFRTELVNYTKSGQKRWVEVNQTPIFSEAGELECTVSVERDINASKEREAALAQAREEAESAAQAKSAFFATMSHEIRTPMNGVLGMAELLQRSQLNVEQSLLVDTITESGQALLTIINDILDYSKLEAGKFETLNDPFQPQKLLKTCVDLLAPLAGPKKLNLKLESTIDPELCVLGDRDRIRQILLNLIGNAIKFTLKGRVTVQASAEHISGRICLKFAIRDTGIGIAEDRLETVFKAFSQAEASTSRRFGGTGLGLSISQKLAEAMGGRIDLTSKVGEGSEFTLLVTLDEDTKAIARDAAKNESENIIDLRGRRILIAEDNRTNRFLIEKYLKTSGLDVHFAIDGEEAVKQRQRLKPDIILMDVSMPRKDGLQATRDIRQWEQDAKLDAIPIIALPANAFEEDRKACLAAGMDAFLTKPVSRTGVLEKISGTISAQKKA